MKALLMTCWAWWCSHTWALKPSTLRSWLHRLHALSIFPCFILSCAVRKVEPIRCLCCFSCTWFLQYPKACSCLVAQSFRDSFAANAFLKRLLSVALLKAMSDRLHASMLRARQNPTTTRIVVRFWLA